MFFFQKKVLICYSSCFPCVGLFTLLSYFYPKNSDTSYLQGDKNRFVAQPARRLAAKNGEKKMSLSGHSDRVVSDGYKNSLGWTSGILK